jgi:AraC family transcriptional regulator
LARAFAQDAELWPPGHHPRNRTQKGKATMKISIQTLPETRMAYMRHTGPYGSSEITQLWMRFAAWAGSAGLMKPRPRLFGVSQDNPQLTAPDKCRYDACIPVDDTFKPSGEIGVQTLWGGRYACTIFTGTPADVHDVWMAFVRELVQLYQPADHPAIEIYEPDFTVDPKTGAFSCVLAVPVRG